MCIYREKSHDSRIYRKIYEQHFGTIPIDEHGRTYEIHHIDGDHYNNDPNNLKAVTIQEHYNIHYNQGDGHACFKIAQRMNLSPEELSLLSKQLLNDLGNPWSKRPDGTSVTSDRVNSPEYVNPWSKRPDGTSHSQDRVKSGTHHLLKRPDGTSVASDRVKSGTNPFQKRADGTSINQGKNHPRCDLTEYSFQHVSGKVEILTCYDMKSKYNVRARYLVNGKLKISRGWKLV